MLEEEGDKVFQNKNGCLVDTAAAVVLSVDCQKSKGDFGKKSNLVELAEGDWEVVSVGADNEAVEVFGGVGGVAGLVQVVVVVGNVVGFVQGEVVEDLQKKNLFNVVKGLVASVHAAIKSRWFCFSMFNQTHAVQKLGFCNLTHDF